MTEELKQIAIIIESMGEAGQTMFVWYMVVDLLKSLMWALVWGGALWLLLGRVGKAIALAVRGKINE